MIRNKLAWNAFAALALAACLGLSCSDDDNEGKTDQGVSDLGGDGGLDLTPATDQQQPDMSEEQLPVIERILPDDGLTSATTPVVLLGKNFKHPATVYINGGEDGIITDTSVASEISMSFAMPPSPLPDKSTPFEVRVRVKSGGVFSNSVEFQYTVTDPMSDGFKGSLRTASLSAYRDFLSDAVEGQVTVDPAEPASELVAEVGLGPDGSTPPEASGWRWFSAEMVGQEGDYQLFRGSVVAYLEQPYDLAYRFSKDGGKRWIYADTDESNLDYEASQAGALTVELAPQYYCQKGDDCLKYAFEWTCDLKTEDSKDNRCVQCLDDADCQANPNALGPRCNTSLQQCYCQEATDCADSDHGDACTSEAYCGCESHDNCAEPKQCFGDEATGLNRCLTPPSS